MNKPNLEKDRKIPLTSISWMETILGGPLMLWKKFLLGNSIETYPQLYNTEEVC